MGSNSALLPKALNMFPRFGELPQELRDSIWEAAVDSVSPQVIAFEQRWWWNKTKRIPALLHTCQDSRNLAHERYKWVDTGKDRPEGSIKPLGCFVDYESDKFLAYSMDWCLSFYGRDIWITESTLKNILAPAKRILSLINDIKYTLLYYRVRHLFNAWNAKEIFALSFDDRIDIETIWHPRCADLVLGDDFVEKFNQYGTGRQRNCSKFRGGWHETDTRCSDSCRQVFDYSRPAMQALDFKQYQKLQQPATDRDGTQAHRTVDVAAQIDSLTLTAE